jgi:hypothetical protein
MVMCRRSGVTSAKAPYIVRKPAMPWAESVLTGPALMA